jgi:formylglycine-generating enzyme required for sulfatase activity
MEMVYVPGGTFRMGSTEGHSREQPVHVVTLDSFWIDRTEVANSQYARCVVDGICSLPSSTGSYTRDSYYGDSEYDDYPVIYVSWYDADAYCQWAGGRLPTEAEWEYAARGPDGHIYPWGNDSPNDTLVNYDGNVGDTTRVGSYPGGASWVGALDMAGNVWEKVADWYGEYPSEAQTNPTGPETGDRKISRGGSWTFNEDGVRADHRRYSTPDDRHFLSGFRCAVARMSLTTLTPAVAPTTTATSVSPTGTPAPPSDTLTPEPSTAPSDASLHDTWTRHTDKMEMVYVPGGTFEMGSTAAEVDAAFEQCEQDRGSGECERSDFEIEAPRHLVTLDGFWIDRIEVTNSQYARCVAEGICSPPSESKSATRDNYYGDGQFDNYWTLAKND